MFLTTKEIKHKRLNKLISNKSNSLVCNNRITNAEKYL